MAPRSGDPEDVVIAPLWSVNDALAKELALDFYPKVFAGRAPAEVLRNARASFDERSQGVSATHLAYQFFGHPALRLTREVPSPR